ncbi:hypothetical protein [Pseudolysinimonas kribbensis]|nr:hypothetical protein [Pseudolysinimonas kribbensis]
MRAQQQRDDASTTSSTANEMLATSGSATVVSRPIPITGTELPTKKQIM